MKEEKEKLFIEKLEGNEFLAFKSIDGVNHKPHPYTIGPKHIVWSNEYSGGMLGEDTIKEGEKRNKCKCAVPGCKISYEDHTYDTVCFLQLKQNCNATDVQPIFNELAEIAKKIHIDGFALIDTKEKFRITN